MSDYEEPESYPAISGNGSPLIDTWIAIRVAEYNHLRAEVERLTVNLKLCKDDSAEMDRRRIAEDTLLRAEIESLQADLTEKTAKADGLRQESKWLVSAGGKAAKEALELREGMEAKSELTKVTSERISPSAQKVERLTRSNERFGLVHGEFMEKLHCQDKKIDTLTAERDRMKAALEKLTDHRTNHILNIKQVQDIARAALMAVQE